MKEEKTGSQVSAHNCMVELPKVKRKSQDGEANRFISKSTARRGFFIFLQASVFDRARETTRKPGTNFCSPYFRAKNRRKDDDRGPSRYYRVHRSQRTACNLTYSIKASFRCLWSTSHTARDQNQLNIETFYP